jgi:hypothetical protein
MQFQLHAFVLWFITDAVNSSDYVYIASNELEVMWKERETIHCEVQTHQYLGLKKTMIELGRTGTFWAKIGTKDLKKQSRISSQLMAVPGYFSYCVWF